MSEFEQNELKIGEAPGTFEDFQWLVPSIEEVSGKAVKDVSVDDFSGAGGLSSATMLKLNANFTDGTTVKYVYKNAPPGHTTTSKNLGLPRESFFYKLLAPKLVEQGVIIPTVVYSYGDMTTGAKTIVMEDLSSGALQSGYFFGPGSPLNWGKDLDALVTTKLPAEVVARDTFRRAASLHATYWKDESLLQYKWLRGQAWRRGEGEETYMAAQNTAITNMTKLRAKIDGGTTQVVWDAHLLSCLEASLAKVSWESYQAEINVPSRPWTLVHGDFHPANMLWRWGSEAGVGSAPGGPVMLDFELVGLGNGPQDLAQYLISHMAPAARREHEESLLQDYYAHLTGTGEASIAGTRHVDPATYSYAQCKADFVAGGTGRWLWFLPVLDNMCPEKMTQYFHDQTAAFLKDHGVTPENVPMPRV